MERYARDLQPELKVNYCRLVSLTVDGPATSRAYRAQIGAEWPFLADEDRGVIEELDIVDHSDAAHPRVPIPYTFVLDGDLVIYKIYNGWWFVGRPTVEELRLDLRALMARRPDFAYDRMWDASEEARRRAGL